MYRRSLICLAAAAAVLLPAGTAVAAPAPARGAQLQAELDAVHAAGMPGAFAEVRDGARTYRLTTGFADVEAGTPVRDGSRHRIGSISKTFLATVVLQLEAERRIRLDAPIGRYLPARLVPAATGRQVTVRMLLNHTSGIGNYTSALIQEADDLVTMGETSYRPEQLARIGLGLPPTGAPGERFSYSNTNYVLAGLIVQAVTGTSYRSEIQRRVLRPLGLRDTYFEGDDPDIRGPHMNAYVPWLDGELRDFSHYRMSWGWGAGEMVSTAADVNTFFRALLTGRLLRPRQLAAMQTTVAEDAETAEVTGYGLGIYWVQAPCGRVWGHDGGTIGHATQHLSSPDGKRQITYAQSMTFYQTSTTEAHPIDVAAATLVLDALCGDRPTARSVTGGLTLPRHDRW